MPRKKEEEQLMEEAPMASATQTQTQVVSITRTKMGIAVAFLGFAAVAAAAAGIAGKNCISNDVTIVDNGMVRVCEQELMLTKSSVYGFKVSKYTPQAVRLLINDPEQWVVSDGYMATSNQASTFVVISVNQTKVFSLVKGGMNVALTYKGMYKNYALFGVETNVGGGQSAVGTLYISMRKNDESFDKDEIFLAGTNAWIGKLRLEAKNEDILVQELKFSNTYPDIANSIQEICLYDSQSESKKLISCGVMDNLGEYGFYNMGYVLTQGIQDFYIRIQSRSIDDTPYGTAKNHDRIQFVLKKGNVIGKGMSSGQQLAFGLGDGTDPAPGQYVFDYDLDGVSNENNEYQTASTSLFVISGSRINDVKLINSYGGEVVDSVLSGTGQYTVAILGVTNEAHNNTDKNGNPLKLGIDSVRFDVEKSYGLKISDVTLQRIGGVKPAMKMSLSGINEVAQTQGTAVAYDMWYYLGIGQPNDSQVNSGETVYFVVKAIVDKLSTSTENFLSFNMDDVNGTYNYDIDNNIDWFADSMNSSTLFNALLLDINSLKGTKLSQ